MDEAAEEPNRSPNQHIPQPSSSSPLSSPTQTWLPVDPWRRNFRLQQNQEPLDQRSTVQSSPQISFYEELCCSSRTSSSLVPLAGALMTSSPGSQSDVVKQGYLRKQECSRRYFVLRGGSHTGPSRLEWYKSQEKFTAAEKTGGKSALFGPSKQGLIYLRCCLGVSRSSSSRKGHMVTLYTKDQTVVLVVEEQREQEEWYQAVKKLMEEEQGDEEHGEEDDGYCTLPPAAVFREVWPVTVKPLGLGSSKCLAGESRLCLTATSLILIKLGACSDLLSVTIPFLTIRRFGHLEGSFFLELGRSAPNGPGEIWMEARDPGSPTVAQHIHEVIRETVRDLQALPDFSCSPTSNHSQNLLPSKRSRLKNREKPVHVRPLCSRPVLPPRTPEMSSSPSQSHKTEPGSSPSSTSPLRSQQGSSPETSSYMTMKMDEETIMETGDHSVMENLEPGRKEEGLGYMTMSPQVCSGSFQIPQDDYETMTSPQKHSLPVNTSLQTSFNSTISDSFSPVRPSHTRISQDSPTSQPWTSIQTEADQSQRSMSISLQPPGGTPQKEISLSLERLRTRILLTSSPLQTENGSRMMVPFPSFVPDTIRPIGTSPNMRPGRSGPSQEAANRRSRLALCLPSCLNAEDSS